ncbi:MAG: hydantoinase/carbamoylase family amidase [Bdellovibrionales bacterium]|nr:hydantoinase/carbamoylase family amidase [Bdellovibrionales bacterium]
MEIRGNELLGLIEAVNVKEDGMLRPRPAFSEYERIAHDTLCRPFADLDVTICRDPVGNTVIRRAGRNKTARAVAVLSHLDTVYTPGEYDGTVGCCAAAHIITRLCEENITLTRPVEAHFMAAEESSRWGVGCVGSRLRLSLLNPQAVLDLRDADGVGMREAMRACGLAPEALGSFTPEPPEFAIELHPEQGPVLEHQGLPVGFVTAIAAPARLRVAFIGETNHSGACPMHLRKDALPASAELILRVEQLARESEDTYAVATVGYCHVEPNYTNAIPGLVELIVDVRGVDLQHRDAMLAEIKASAHQIAERRALGCTIKVLQQDRPELLSEELLELFEHNARKRKLGHTRLVSGAAHDVLHFSKAMCPVSAKPATQAGLIFIASRGGKSHCPDEFSEPEHIIAGAQIALDTVLTLAER